MNKGEIILSQPNDNFSLEVRSKIQIIRGTAVMIDRDLAVLYSVDTKRINEQAVAILKDSLTGSDSNSQTKRLHNWSQNATGSNH